MNILNATNVTQCLEYLMEYSTTPCWRYFKRRKLKEQIKNQFLLPMQADQRKVKPILNKL